MKELEEKKNTLLCVSYDDAYKTNLPWILNIKGTRERNGMMCRFINTFQEKTLFVFKKLFLRLSDEFHQNALGRINDNQSKLRTYNLLKQEIETEHYLHCIRNPSISKCRLSNHTLMIEKGTHAIFPLCKDKIECELNFLINCPCYKTLRCHILEPLINVRTNYNSMADIKKLKYLLSEENTQITGRFLFEALELRESILACCLFVCLIVCFYYINKVPLILGR